jgi:hypothetical protein
VQVGELVAHPDWYNAGYIFPAGFKSRLLFRSSVDLDALTLHECEIVGEGGQFWPAPTFVVTARDREDEPIVAKSCTGCWSGVSVHGGVGVISCMWQCSKVCFRLYLASVSGFCHECFKHYGVSPSVLGCALVLAM